MGFTIILIQVCGRLLTILLNLRFARFYEKITLSDVAIAISRLYIGLFPSDPITAETASKSMGRSICEVTGELTIRTDFVYEIMARNQAIYPVRLSHWSIGYEMALDYPNSCLFTMDRTEIRENLFNWAGPIGTNTTYFFTLSGSGIVINALEEARGLTSE